MKATQEPESKATSASDVILNFFESIPGPHPEVPKPISGSLRFDVEDGKTSDYWRVIFAKGVVSSARSKASADCVVHTDKATLEAIIQGRANAMAALLRGAMRVEGETFLMVYFRRLFTAPAAEHKARRLGEIGRRA